MSAEDLFRAARDVRARAYVPYSNFAVGAAVRTASGRIFAAVNVENAAYPQGQCAEASVIGAMVAAGERRITEVAVVAGGERLCSPCGGCRQRLAEFAGPDTKVHMGSPEGIRVTATLGELLPYAFSSENLATPATAPADADAADLIRARAGGTVPRIALVLGSGLGAIADRLETPVTIDYAELPGFPRPRVEGHAGRLVMGRLAGVPLLCLAGRAHLYEGSGTAPLNTMIRALHAAGCEALLLTNAAGSLRPEVGAGELVLIDDHINLQGTNPLVGRNDDTIGPSFLDLSEVYSSRLRQALLAAAERVGMPLARGVYLAVLGPCFETPAEIRAYRVLGADLVGMSTVSEAISARHAGLEVAALSIVTNLAAGLAATSLSHEDTLAAANAALERVTVLLEAALPEIAHALA